MLLDQCFLCTLSEIKGCGVSEQWIMGDGGCNRASVNQIFILCIYWLNELATKLIHLKGNKAELKVNSSQS